MDHAARGAGPDGLLKPRDALPTLDLEAAREAVSRIAVRTPLLRAPALEATAGRHLLKPENLQVTGSFKVRGAAARMATLTAGERRRGVIACSSGNHGRAVAHVAGELGIPATICVPEWVDPMKRRAMVEAGADVRLAGSTYDAAAARAEALREEQNSVFIHPFDDPRVIAGQATLALEILDDVEGPLTIVAPLSGGGLVGGIAYVARQRRDDVHVVAASAERARVMVESLREGRPVRMDEEETLASALAGGIGEENRYTLSLVRHLVDEHVLMTEDEIARAMVFAAERLHLVVEGGGAVALAAVLAGGVAASAGDRDSEDPGTVVIVLSGGNVDLPTLAALKDR